MIDEYFTNLREEVDGLLENNGRTEEDIEEVLISDDDGGDFTHIDPQEFLEKGGDALHYSSLNI